MLLSQCQPLLGKELIREIQAHASTRTYAAGDYIVKQGQTIKALPIVLSGHVKVWGDEGDVQFLLYYIRAGGTCIFSLAHLMDTQPSEFSAVAEVDSVLLLLPMNKVLTWLDTYPKFNQMLLRAYQEHYHNLLESTKAVLCYNLEERLWHYLKDKAEVMNSALLNLTHQDIANDLGSSREVVSRLLKKLSLDSKVKQEGRKIRVLL